MLWAQAEIIDKFRNNWVLIAIGLGVVCVAIVLFRIATARKKPHRDLEKGQRDDLAEYPPPPPSGAIRLSVDGIPARLRLVVIAPAGKAHDPISFNDVPELLDEIVRGLGDLVQADKPRIKFWPTPLSAAGFAPTFHRLIESPDAGKKSSRWVKIAGPAKIRERPILLGLALLTNDSNKLGDINVEAREWAKLLQVHR